jgi:hypothetical protein
MEPPLELALPSEYPSLISPPIPLSSMDSMSSLFGITQVPLPDQSGNFNGHALSADYSVFPDQSASYAPFKSAKVGAKNSNDRVYLNDPEDILLLRVFVEEVGLWMDSMDAVKHVRTPIVNHLCLASDLTSSPKYCHFTHWRSLCF